MCERMGDTKVLDHTWYQPRTDYRDGRNSCERNGGASHALKHTKYQLEQKGQNTGRAAIPHSHLPAGIVVTMRQVVNYHSSLARQQQVELFDASGNPGSTAGHGFNPASGAPGGG
ncbi:protein pelota-like [Dorcoceras hygrometricum]|uniref:Protein pelota-like n=1 Tax=Dorcoceras hygrometricum TaxID=472368 RepID=A0A2Z7CYH8_9LAMI|nr:protein pelota-like [Dorcoceras hygrometricum]